MVEKIGLIYPVYEDLRNALAEIFSYMPYDYAEEKAIRLLREETDPGTRTFLAGALCDIFSLKSGDMIIDIIRKSQYDPSIMELLGYLIPVYVYHNKTIDNLAELESIEREFRDERYYVHPLFSRGKYSKSLEGEDAVEDEDPGASDFDTAGSQERKRMPMSLIPSKKRNKSKKKKRKSKRH